MSSDTPTVKLDSLTCPLNGLVFIEAGAGTGKTYNIQNIVVRLLVEKAIPIDQIVVVTYTEAATAELKDRIRTVLKNIYSRLHAGVCIDAKENDRVEKLIERFFLIRDPEECRKLVLDAIRSFDDAGISTIHGFCRKILSENSFESGILFNFRLEKSVSDIISSLVEDFYRREFYPTDDDSRLKYAVIKYKGLMLENGTEGALKSLCKTFVARPDLRLNTGFELSGSSLQEKFLSLRNAYKNILANIHAAGDALDSFNGLLKSAYSNEVLTGFKRDIEMLVGEPKIDTCALLHILDKIQPENLWNERFQPAGEKNKLKSNEAVSAALKQNSSFFNVLTVLLQAASEYAIAVKAAAAEYCLTELEKLKERDNFQTFDDLLRKVNCGLQNYDSALLRLLRTKLKAAVVDEFQDTDPVQYSIFKKIFAESEGHALFMVGDPRQSIYAFRGGDIAAYLKARDYVGSRNGARNTLDVNYRSCRNIIKSISHIFGGHPYPFASDRIRFGSISSPDVQGSRELDGLLVNEKADEFPFRFSYLRSANGKGMSAESMKDYSFKFCADKILSLLSRGDVKIPSKDDEKPYRKLRPNDIAVLVKDRWTARSMKNLLEAYRIPAVISQAESVFESDEAAYMLKILQAIAMPRSSDLVSEALLTPPLGVQPLEMVKIRAGSEDGDDVFSRKQVEFGELLAKWKASTFIEMFDDLLVRFNVRENLLSAENGERMLTNMLQLAEILHVESISRDLGPDSLIYYLQTQCDESTRDENEEYEIRIETDRLAVRIMTIHKSKGLEFPVVFLPDLFACSPRKDGCTYHADDGTAEYDLAGNPYAASYSAAEQLQEILRLSYVAMTRAKYRCYIVWGDCVQKNRNSGLDWLFRTRHLENLPPLGELAVLPSRSPENPLEEIPAEWQEEPEAEDSLPSSYKPDEPLTPDDLSCRATSLEIDHAWTVTSYSGLTPSSSDDSIMDDVDQVDNLGIFATSPDSDLADIFKFPAGANVGNACHEIFEDIDFTAPDADILPVATAKLKTYGLAGDDDEGKHRIDVTCTMIRNVLSADLSMSGSDEKFRLDSVTRGNRLSELGFNFTFTEKFHTKQIEDILSGYAAERFSLKSWPEWDRFISGGFMTGFMDLVLRHDDKYFIADWKSNMIGAKFRNFEEKGLRSEMCRHFYFLQYLFYTAALMKFLRNRLRIELSDESEYKKYIGGVYYIFLRGVAPDAPGRGIFHEYVPFSIVRKLEGILR